ncbi:hypothetical protein HZC53_02530 [Candidatus Uhrbacteria bacterium]|nr:hypothetical protein [Candidatus Uhrbacteria bacterium]
MSTATEKSINSFIFTFVGAVLLAVVLVFLYMAWRQPYYIEGKVQIKPMDLKQLHQDWMDEVARQTRGLGQDSDPDRIQSAVDSLLALRVASEDKDSHLKLVMALMALERREPGAWPKVQSVLAELPIKK